VPSAFPDESGALEDSGQRIHLHRRTPGGFMARPQRRQGQRFFPRPLPETLPLCQGEFDRCAAAGPIRQTGQAMVEPAAARRAHRLQTQVLPFRHPLAGHALGEQ